MAGEGKRFKDAGYRKVKPLINIHGKPIIEYVIKLFPQIDQFIFILNENQKKNTLITKKLNKLVKSPIIVVDKNNKKLGSAYHSLLANDYLKNDDRIIISYDDFYMSWDFGHFKKWIVENDCDGAVVSYYGFHPHLLGNDLYGSLITDKNKNILKYREKYSWTKNKMNCHQSAGIYYFRSWKIAKTYLEKVINSNNKIAGEYYISQAFPLMKKDRLKTSVYDNVDFFCQWGTPEDLKEYLNWIKIVKKVSMHQDIFDYWHKFFNKEKNTIGK